MILSTLVIKQQNFEKFSRLYGHPIGILCIIFFSLKKEVKGALEIYLEAKGALS